MSKLCFSGIGLCLLLFFPRELYGNEDSFDPWSVSKNDPVTPAGFRSDQQVQLFCQPAGKALDAQLVAYGYVAA